MAKYAKRPNYAEESASIADADHHRCAFLVHGSRCPEAGTMTEDVVGPGPGQPDSRRWLCRWHYQSRHDIEGARRVLDDLVAHKPPHVEDWRDKLVEAHIANVRDDPLMARAALIAEGRGSDEDKQDLLQDLQRRLGKFIGRAGRAGTTA